MAQFAAFKKTHGRASECRSAPKARITAFRKKLPASLIAEWEESGWGAYGGGLLWLVDPDELKATVRDWLGKSSKAVAFARSAFGHLFVWDRDGAHMLDPHHGTLAKLIDDVDLVFDYTLCSTRYLDTVLDQKLFVKAHKQLGALAHDECYGFEPAIALGGKATVKSVRKLKLREHLAVLSQLVDELQTI